MGRAASTATIAAAGLAPSGRRVESGLRPHYVRTIRAWLDNLERNLTAVEAIIGVERARLWRLCLAGGALGVRGGADGRRPDPRGRARMTGAAFGWAALAADCSVLALVAATFAIGARTGRHSVMDVAVGREHRGRGGRELPGVGRARRASPPVAAACRRVHLGLPARIPARCERAAWARTRDTVSCSTARQATGTGTRCASSTCHSC